MGLFDIGRRGYDLLYPKKFFTRKEILEEKRSMRFPEHWELKSTKTDYILKFKPR